jgi:polar amino acid transport system permease protein
MPLFDYSLLLTGQYHDMLVQGLLLSLQLPPPAGARAAVRRCDRAAAAVAHSRRCAASVLRTSRASATCRCWRTCCSGISARRSCCPKASSNGSTRATSRRQRRHRAGAVHGGLHGRRHPQRHPRDSRGADGGRPSLGFSYLAPCAWCCCRRRCASTVPPLISQTVNLWKNTSVATVIGAAEMMYQAGAAWRRPPSAASRRSRSRRWPTSRVAPDHAGRQAWYQRRFPVRTTEAARGVND